MSVVIFAVVVAAITLVLLLVSRTTIYRLFGAGRAQLSRVGRYAIEADPIAVLQDRRDKASESLIAAVEIQSQSRGHLESLKRQIASNKNEMSKLDAKIRSALNINDEEAASRHALDMQKEKKQLGINEDQLASLQSTYDTNMKRIRIAESTIKSIDDDARRLKVELRFSEVEKDLVEAMSKVRVGVDMGSINEAKEEARRQIDSNRGAVLVRSELDADSIREYEMEEQEEMKQAKTILDQYRSLQ